VKDNPECTKTDVTNYLGGYHKGKKPIVTLSYRPAFGLVTKLIESKKIFCSLDNANPKIHRLRINDKDAFNEINIELSIIGKFIRKMEDGLNKSYSTIEMHPPAHLEGLKKVYSIVIPVMLQSLMIRTSKSISDEENKQLLHTRIIDLTEKFGDQLDINDQWFDWSLIEMYLGKSNSRITSNLYSHLLSELGLIFGHFTKNFLKNEWKKYQETLCDNHCNGPKVSKKLLRRSNLG